MFESIKYTKDRESFMPIKDDVELLHNSVKSFLPPKQTLNSNVGKRFSIRYNSEEYVAPFVTVSPEDEYGFREVFVSLEEHSSSKAILFSYFLSNKGDLAVKKSVVSDFSDMDRSFFIEKCKDIENSLIGAQKRDLIWGWDAVPENITVD